MRLLRYCLWWYFGGEFLTFTPSSVDDADAALGFVGINQRNGNPCLEVSPKPIRCEGSGACFGIGLILLLRTCMPHGK